MKYKLYYYLIVLDQETKTSKKIEIKIEGKIYQMVWGPMCSLMDKLYYMGCLVSNNIPTMQ